MPEITVRDTILHIERTGSGERSLVFVHGMCGGGWVWQDQIARLADRFDCVAYDRRGHSRSKCAPTDHEQSARTHAEDLRALIEALGLHRPIVVASSGGAVVTMELLHRCPEIVAGAVLSEPPLFSIDEAAGDKLMRRLQAPVDQALLRSGARAAVEVFFDIVAPGLWQTLDDDRRRAYRDNGELLLQTLRAPQASLSLDDVMAIHVPICVVAGKKSALLGSLARRLAAALPNGWIVDLDDAGHATYVDAPEAFATAVVDTAVVISRTAAATAALEVCHA